MKNKVVITDLARYKNKVRTDYIIQNWMRTTNSLIFLGACELLNNKNFNSIEFDGFKKESRTNSFVLTPKKWIKSTNAIEIISQQKKIGNLNESARRKMRLLKNNKSIKDLRLFQKQTKKLDNI